jgi:putative transposase
MADVGWGELLRQLGYKARWYGRTFVRIDRRYPSSKLSHACRYMAESLPLNVRYWECPSCGTVLDRDVNAAQNIKDAGLAELAAGLAVSACGGGVRPTRKRVGGPRRSRKPR